jgi:phosphoribosylformylglycinamidine cyclo-ligase
MTAVVDKCEADKALACLASSGEQAYVYGEVTQSGEGVILC